MGKREIVKDILVYFISPEDSTEAGGGVNLLTRSSLHCRQGWLGPLKTVVWMTAAVVAPLLFCIVLG